MISARYSTHLGLVGMAALWGASWPWGRVVAQAMPPLAAACLRFVLASVVLLLWLKGSGRMHTLGALRAQQWWGLTAAAAVGVLGYASFFLLALKTVPAGKAAMVVALNPVLTLIFAVLLFRESVNWVMGIGLILAVTGALYALTDGSLAVMQPGLSGTGELLLLGCAGCWVGYTLIGRKVLFTVDSLTTTAVTAVIGAIFLFIASMAVEGPAAWKTLATVSTTVWFSLMALAFGSTALAYAWYLHGVKVLGAGAAAAYMALVPLFGMLFSGLWLGEPLTKSLLAGGVMAIVGMALMNFGRMFLPKQQPNAAS
ncbi:DMT family transporter [Ottowia thiooxydans]|uniref:DMT family transporter n=1 Tax=Ottowia thiooxydans TaxID=219182 RepID=UPI00048F9D05|nr:DMT family transporter [Ottowia thiooxydans]